MQVEVLGTYTAPRGVRNHQKAPYCKVNNLLKDPGFSLKRMGAEGLA